MDRKVIIPVFGSITLLVGLFMFFTLHNADDVATNKLAATVLSVNDSTVMVQDKDNVIYTFEMEDTSTCTGNNVLLEYTGLLNKNMELQDVFVVNCNTVVTNSDSSFPSEWQDEGIFQNYYTLAYNKMREMTLEEKIAQTMLVRYPDDNQVSILDKYQFGGYVFYEKDFADKTKSQVKEMMSDLQEVAEIPILTAVDEEGGKVVRVSSNPKLADSEFLSPSLLYLEGGLDLVRDDTLRKSTLLNSLGLNLNLAPVVDVTTDSNAYMYERTLQQDAEITSDYAKTVILASKSTGVSYTLKHFPGYGNNTDTHISSAIDTRSYNEILSNDILPFEAGISVGAEAVLVSHNTVSSIDSDNPASLSVSVHNLLRNRLDFTGIIIADALDMAAASSDDVAVKAIMAGNDLIITTDYEDDITAIKKAIDNGTLSEATIEKLATRVIAWKYYKGLMFDNQK